MLQAAQAGFLHQFVRGADLATCLAWGNRAGAYSTTKTGGTEAFRDRAGVALVGVAGAPARLRAGGARVQLQERH